MASRCNVCDKPFTTLRRLQAHVAKQHRATPKINAHLDNIRKVGRDERRSQREQAALPQQLSMCELSALRPGSEAHTVYCLLCEPPREILKTSVSKHMSMAHEYDKEDLNTWVVSHDAKILRRGDDVQHCKFEAYFVNDQGADELHDDMNVEMQYAETEFVDGDPDDKLASYGDHDPDAARDEAFNHALLDAVDPEDDEYADPEHIEVFDDYLRDVVDPVDDRDDEHNLPQDGCDVSLWRPRCKRVASKPHLHYDGAEEHQER
jgi:hypothetical protein